MPAHSTPMSWVGGRLLAPCRIMRQEGSTHTGPRQFWGAHGALRAWWGEGGQYGRGRQVLREWLPAPCSWNCSGRWIVLCMRPGRHQLMQGLRGFLKWFLLSHSPSQSRSCARSAPLMCGIFWPYRQEADVMNVVNAFCERVKEFTGKAPRFAFGMADGEVASRKALQSVFKPRKVLMRWFHILRALRKQVKERFPGATMGG